jgi:hypothetical protein
MMTNLVAQPLLSLTLLEEGRNALEQARTLADVKEIKDIAVGAERYARARKLGADALGYAIEIVLRADRRLGQLLNETPKHPPGPDRSGAVTDPPTLAELGISKNESSLAQQIADIPEPVFEELIANSDTLSKAGVLRAAKDRIRVAGCRVPPDERPQDDAVDKLIRLLGKVVEAAESVEVNDEDAAAIIISDTVMALERFRERVAGPSVPSSI